MGRDRKKKGERGKAKEVGLSPVRKQPRISRLHFKCSCTYIYTLGKKIMNPEEGHNFRICF